MSNLTKVLHRQNYAAIDAAAPEHSQAGRHVLITGSTGGIGLEIAKGFVKAGADTVIVTSRKLETAKKTAQELEAARPSHASTKVIGRQYDTSDESAVAQLWDSLQKEGIEIDTAVFNAVSTSPEKRVVITPSAVEVFKTFESSIKNQLIMTERFFAQGPKAGKILLNVTSSTMSLTNLPPETAAYSSCKMAMSRLMQELARVTDVKEVRIISFHPGFCFTPLNEGQGLSADTFPFDDTNLPGNYAVWAASSKAEFLHGKTVWANWDVDELMAMKPRIEQEAGFLTLGLQGVPNESVETMLGGLMRSV